MTQSPASLGIAKSSKIPGRDLKDKQSLIGFLDVEFFVVVMFFYDRNLHVLQDYRKGLELPVEF